MSTAPWPPLRLRSQAWSKLAAADRGRLLLRLADAIEANADELARLESLDTGHPLRDSTVLDVPRAAAAFRYFGGIADKLQGDIIPVEQGFLNYVTREPLGVVGQIVPWNFPLMFCGWKLGPALAAGNCAVMKPSELTPLTSLRLAELIAEVGVPAGVVNMVPGYGTTAGQRIAEHPDIAKVSFTGSTATGRRIVEASAGNLKRLQLELGGKGANVVFADADLDLALNGAAFAIFHNQGQACIAGSRLLLHESIAEEFCDRFVALARSIRVGHPMAATTEMGPLTSPMHRDRVLSYVKVALDEGAEILTGGKAPDDPDLAHGCYIEPTVVRAEPDHRVCREEVFGPFVTVSTFRDDDEAIRIANSTDYGLGAGLWTRDLSRARTRWRRRSGPGWSGSTATSVPTRAHRSAGSAAPATGARWGSRRCTSTPSRIPCGSTSMPNSPSGTRAHSSSRQPVPPHPPVDRRRPRSVCGLSTLRRGHGRRVVALTPLAARCVNS